MHWLIENWHAHFQSPWTEIILAFAAVISGWIVGAERERQEKPAGLRTLILVSLGSAGYTMGAYALSGNVADTARVVAQIVSGIGFLGAGVIMHGRNTNVNGTTTAAAIWTIAAAGMIAGAGFPLGAIGLSLLVRMLLSLVSVFETHVTGERREMLVMVGFEPRNGITCVRLKRLLVDYRISTIAVQWLPAENGLERLELRTHLHRLRFRELLDEIVSIDAVKSIEEIPVSPASKS
ncbi:MAG TPA: MgtC/SapB family protein [Chthoniobacteraceae bacterium]|jgi:putative Mg2+ transporter-C (MgtC) family protein